MNARVPLLSSLEPRRHQSGQAGNGCNELMRLDRLGNVSLKAGTKCLGAIFRAGVRGESDGRDAPPLAGVELANPTNQLVAIDLRQADVADQDMRTRLG